MAQRYSNIRTSVCITNLQKIEATFWNATTGDQLSILKALGDYLKAKHGQVFERKYAADLLVRAIVAMVEIGRIDMAVMRPFLDSLRSSNCASPLSKSLLSDTLQRHFPGEADSRAPFGQTRETRVYKQPKFQKLKRPSPAQPLPAPSHTDPFPDESEPKVAQKEVNLYNFVNTVQSILETDYLKACSSSNLSFALLDLDGYFLFACRNARRLFGLTSKNLNRLNFHELLTPFSIFEIQRRYPEGLFNFAACPNTKKRVSYVVFSKRCEKNFKVCSKAISEEKRRRLINHMTDEDIANLCVESLHSSIEIVQLRITKSDFENWQSEDGDIREVYIGRATRRNRGIFKPFVKGKLKPTKGLIDIRRSGKSEAAESQTIPAVLVRTWLATKMFDYPYAMLNNHHKIRDFKKMIAQDLQTEAKSATGRQTPSNNQN